MRITAGICVFFTAAILIVAVVVSSGDVKADPLSHRKAKVAVSPTVEPEIDEEFVKTMTEALIPWARGERGNLTIPKSNPLFQKLLIEYPELKGRFDERGHTVEEIVRVLNREPRYREIINGVLKAQELRGCKSR